MTTREPVEVPVEGVVVLPTNKLPLIPAPPPTTSEPVEVLVEAVVEVIRMLPTDKFPLNATPPRGFSMPPIYMLPPIPTPPATTRAPVDVLVDVVVEVWLVVPPTYRLPPTPTPPVTTRAPVDVLVDVVVEVW
jgi:hypothetical protein